MTSRSESRCLAKLAAIDAQRDASGANYVSTNAGPSGTWRALSSCNILTDTALALMQRIN